MTLTIDREELGHRFAPHISKLDGDTVVKACIRCRCWEGSVASNLPCGDPQGHTVHKFPSLLNGRCIYEYVWNGYTIGWRYRD